MKRRALLLEICCIAIVCAVALVICGMIVYQHTLGSHPPPIVGQNCGEITSSLGGQNTGRYAGPFTGPTAATQGINCFWQAYTTCKAATIVYTRMGVDTSDSNTFTLQPQNSSCRLTVTILSRINVSPSTKHGPYTCSRLEQQGEDLVARGCGAAGDLLIPSDVQTLTPTPGGAG